MNNDKSVYRHCIVSIIQTSKYVCTLEYHADPQDVCMALCRDKAIFCLFLFY